MGTCINRSFGVGRHDNNRFFYVTAKAQRFLPGDSEKFRLAELGQMGDYFGGLVNPVVSLAALALLAWSIRIQKQELAETRKALEESASAQQAQAKASMDSVRLAALTAMHDVLSRREPALNSRAMELSKQIMAASSTSNVIPYLQNEIKKVQDELNAISAEKEKFSTQILEML